METEISLKELLTALCKAQSEYPDIPKTRTGQEGNRKFKYADLNDIHKATRQINAKHGLTTPHTTTDTHLITKLFHAPSGQCLTTQLPLKLAENLKLVGAALTYLKRYNIQSLLDISTEEDLDAIDSKDKKPEGETSPNASANTSQPPKQPVNPPQKPQDTGMANNVFVTEPQIKRLFAIAGTREWSKEQIKAYLLAAFQLESTKDLRSIEYDAFISVIQSHNYLEAIKLL